MWLAAHPLAVTGLGSQFWMTHLDTTKGLNVPFAVLGSGTIPIGSHARRQKQKEVGLLLKFWVSLLKDGEIQRFIRNPGGEAGQTVP
jgi:hypothetical protein